MPIPRAYGRLALIDTPEETCSLEVRSMEGR